MKKSNVYTRTGDRGTTSLVGGLRVGKNSPRLEAYGTLDELNANLGMLLSLADADPRLSAGGFPSAELRRIQNRLFDIGSYLACDPDGPYQLPAGITDEVMASIETLIDRIDGALPRHNRFLLPGGTPTASQAHVCRTVCRRAERRILSLAAEAEVDPAVIAYVNRLSDLLFVISRQANQLAGEEEIFWEKA